MGSKMKLVQMVLIEQVRQKIKKIAEYKAEIELHPDKVYFCANRMEEIQKLEAQLKTIKELWASLDGPPIDWSLVK